MMKPILYTVLLACLATACSDEHEPGGVLPDGNGSAVPLEIASATLEGEAATITRAGVTTPLTSGSIGVFLEGKEAGSIYTKTDNCQYTYNSATGKWEVVTPDATIYLGGEDANVCAFYPYKAKGNGYDDKTAFPLSCQEYASDKELFYAVNSVVNGTSAQRKVTFAMGHAYSQIQLKVTRENYPAACVISAITLKNSLLASTGTINITNGTVTQTATADYSLSFSSPKTLGEDETYTRSLLMVPAALATDVDSKSLIIEFIVDGQTMIAGLPAADLPSLDKGEKYVIGVKIKGKEISITSVTAVPWDDEQVNGGTEYEPKPKPAS